MYGVNYISIKQQDVGQRLDNYLIKILKGVPKTCIYRNIRKGSIRINKKRSKICTKLVLGDCIRIPPIRTAVTAETKIPPNIISILSNSIIYEDDELLILNKPVGFAVHGGSGQSFGIIEALRKIKKDTPYLELVHRLDKETSGCLLIAKKRSVLRGLHSLLEQKTIKKIYWAILEGKWSKKHQLKVENYLKKNTLHSGERMVTINQYGKLSLTEFKVLQVFKNACLVEAIPKTGRTHQIRVHAASLNHPILGDIKYGCKEKYPELKNRLYLHARSITFELNQKKYSFQAELDNAFNNALNNLKSEPC